MLPKLVFSNEKRREYGLYCWIMYHTIYVLAMAVHMWHYDAMKFLKPKKKRIYLDYAAATPIRQAVIDLMKPFLRDQFANASAIHQEGVKARLAIDAAREKVARLLKARPEHVYFTGSGTESNNLAILGVIEAKRVAGVAYADMEVLSTRIEHPSVTQTLLYIEGLGVQVRYAAVSEEGLIQAESLQQLLSEKTVLVTFAYVNSEIGTVQEVGKLTRVVRAFEKKHTCRIYVHADAAQAPLWLSCELDRLMVDMLSLDAGKCYGPKGVGVLILRHGVVLSPVLHGGPQEGGLRPATENVAGIVGAAEALRIAQAHFDGRVQKVTHLRNFMIGALLEIEGVVLNGSQAHRVANNVNISVPGIDSEFAVVVLDEKGIACSTKSACSGAAGGGSSVVMEISNDASRATSSIRFSLGEETTHTELKRVVATLQEHVEKTRGFGV